jgi:hypothetical protein
MDGNLANENALISEEQLIRYVEAVGENDHIDAKGPMKWDGKEHSASLAKDIAAFSNSEGGGVLVIGKSETDDGQFDLSTGCDEEQRLSFETTKVATWVNNYFSPDISLVVCPFKYQNETNTTKAVWFVVIVIDEFADIPSLCTKDYVRQSDKKHLLKKGSLYVRNKNASSAPLTTCDELRPLIGLAVRKKSDELLKIFSSISKGRSILSPETESKPFDEQEAEILSQLTSDPSSIAGHWSFKLHSSEFKEDRFDTAKLRELIQRCRFKRRDGFPECNIHDVEDHLWGIAEDTIPDYSRWFFTKSGLFWYEFSFRENVRDFQWTHSDPSFPANEQESVAGSYLDYERSLLKIVGMFQFARRLAEVFGYEEDLVVDIEATAITGRLLRSNQRAFFDRRTARKDFHFRRTIRRELFMADWKEICEEALFQFVFLFRTKSPDRKHLRQFIDVTE